MPGPGAYEKKTLIGGPGSEKYSLGIKPFSRNDNRVPGPGTYDPQTNLTFERSPSPSMPKGEKGSSLAKDGAPGPGTYDVKGNKFANISYTMSGLERASLMSKDARLNPGPGHYTQRDHIGNEGAKYSMRPRAE